jgi:hypothetical protein
MAALKEEVGLFPLLLPSFCAVAVWGNFCPAGSAEITSASHQCQNAVQYAVQNADLNFMGTSKVRSSQLSNLPKGCTLFAGLRPAQNIRSWEGFFFNAVATGSAHSSAATPLCAEQPPKAHTDCQPSSSPIIVTPFPPFEAQATTSLSYSPNQFSFTVLEFKGTTASPLLTNHYIETSITITAVTRRGVTFTFHVLFSSPATQGNTM